MQSQLLKLYKKAISNRFFRKDIAFFEWVSGDFCRRCLRCIQHIFNEDSITSCRIIDQNVCDRADDLIVLNDGRAAQ